MRVLFYYRGGEHIGLESLISYLKSKGHEIELAFDPGLGDNGYLDIPLLNKFCNDQLIIEKAIRFRPDLIAFSSITNLYSTITKLARKFKEVLDVPIIIGGIHHTSLPEEVIVEDCYDMLCIGEGEMALEELLQRLKEKRSYTDIENLWVKDGSGKIHKNPKRPLIKPLDFLPPPDKTLFNKYGVLTSRIMVMTSRGCPFSCTFCVNSFRNNLYESENYLRQRSVPNVIDELIRLKNTYRPKAFRFEDDVFAFNVKWLREFKEAYRQHINLPFHCYVTPTTAKDPVLKELQESGCSSVSMGVQSGSVEIRKKILNRKHSDESIIAAAQRIKNHKIKLISEFIFGFPEETPADMWKSLELNDQLSAYNTASFIFYPYPQTDLAKYCLEKGYLSDDNYKLIKQGHGSYHTTCLLNHDHISEVYKFNSILPIYNKTPKLLKPLLRKILTLKYSVLHKFIYLFSIPMIDFDEFIMRIKDMPQMIIKTRRALKN
jgi:radical SAM superfamily enzyme YgiQ (UPF0313 family)